MLPFLEATPQDNIGESYKKLMENKTYLEAHPERSDDITTFFEALLQKEEIDKETHEALPPSPQEKKAAPLPNASTTKRTGPIIRSPAPLVPPPPLKEEKIKVGFLVPKSGPYASIGESLHHAAEMALFDGAFPPFEILPRDTKGTAEGARAAAENVIQEGARFIVGPLLSEETRSIIPLLEKHAIGLLTFSNNPSLATSEHLYIFGMIIEQSLMPFIPYLEKETPKALLIILTPSKQSKTLEHIIKKLLTPKLAAVTKFVHVPLDDISDRFIETIGLYDTLWIPEMRQETTNLVERIRIRYQPHQLRILGSPLWGYPSHVKTPFFKGAIISGTEPLLEERFFEKYMKKFSKEPEVIASLAYDAIALLIDDARKRGNAFQRETLTSREGFKGLNGVFSFDEKGLAHRHFNLFEIKEGGLLQKMDLTPPMDL